MSIAVYSMARDLPGSADLCADTVRSGGVNGLTTSPIATNQIWIKVVPITEPWEIDRSVEACRMVAGVGHSHAERAIRFDLCIDRATAVRISKMEGAMRIIRSYHMPVLVATFLLDHSSYGLTGTNPQLPPRDRACLRRWCMSRKDSTLPQIVARWNIRAGGKRCTARNQQAHRHGSYFQCLSHYRTPGND
jgi:hypothetical protein